MYAKFMFGLCFNITSSAWNELRFVDMDLGESDVVHMNDVDAAR